MVEPLSNVLRSLRLIFEARLVLGIDFGILEGLRLDLL